MIPPRLLRAALTLGAVVSVRLATAPAIAAENNPATTALFDFSSAGYAGGGVALPAVPGKFELAPRSDHGDDTPAIQAALDAVAKLPLTADGFRGAVVLRAGLYHVAGQIVLNTSGVVLRGHDATLLATGHSRRTLIEVRGAADRTLGASLAVSDEAVSVGQTRLTLADTASLAPGMRVIIHRPSPKEWIAALGMDKFTGNFKELRLDWLPGSRDVEWERTVTAVDAPARTITLDLPLTTALEKRFGGATVQTLVWPGRLRQVGVEGLTLDSEFDASRAGDEEHPWIGVRLDRIEDAWVRDIAVRHFVSAAVWLGLAARRVTVSDIRSESPVAENGGWRRLGFYVGGEQSLVLRCTADAAREAFALGHAAAGPNVFLDCTATHALADSGAIESWSSGALFDSVHLDGAGLVLGNLGPRNQGAGWAAANSVAWNVTATGGVSVENPPGAENRSVTDAATPSLYRAQLAARLGSAALAALEKSPLPADEKKSVTVAAPIRHIPPAPPPLTLTHGRFTVAGRALFGPSLSNAWWKGQLIPSRAATLGVSPTRWAPGRDDPGLTEDLDTLTTGMSERGEAMFQAWPGLWYDRRRDAHVTTMWDDAAVWGPFYESPWARSGTGRAADGLSRYDLTKFNPWYWDRLHELAEQCAAKGLVLLHHFYNNHNLQEASAHYAEFAWRSANCLQATGFAEPPPYEGPSRSTIHLADQFYDLTHPVRRELHHLLIWHGLDALADQPNVVHTLGFQFAGPLAFQQFFLDEIAAWQIARGKKVHVALVTSKAVTDAILADPRRAPLVDTIDTRTWQYLPDGSLFAPDGLGKLAFREIRTAQFGRDVVPPTTPELVYRQVREYRDRFPDKAIVANHAGCGPLPILLAGGALPLLGDYASAQPFKTDRDDGKLLAFIRAELAGTLAAMNPRDDVATDAWCLADEGKNFLFYSLRGATITLHHPFDAAAFSAGWLDPRTGATQTARLGDGVHLAKPDENAWVLLVRKSKS